MNIINFAVLHKPTQQWVKLTNYGTEITLTNSICNATLAPIGPHLIESIKKCSFEENPRYGEENFLEFSLKKINIQYKVLDE